MSKDRTKSRLGRGLSSLLSISDPAVEESSADELAAQVPSNTINVNAAARVDPPAASATTGLPTGATVVVEIQVEAIRPNPHQPRREFNQASLADLAASLKSTGLVQPIIVRQVQDGYELIAGERRLRAAKLAGLPTLPAFIKAVDGPTQAQMALVENIQREDLNPIDRAQAYRHLIDTLGLTQGELAIRVGEDRSSIGHYLRLLDLSEPVKAAVLKGELSLGHAKLLVGIGDTARQQALAKRTTEEGLSVRVLEQLIAEPAPAAPAVGSSRPAGGSAAHIKDLEQSFTRHLGMKVQIRASSTKGKGKLIIQYQSLDEFDSLKDRLGIKID